MLHRSAFLRSSPSRLSTNEDYTQLLRTVFPVTGCWVSDRSLAEFLRSIAANVRRARLRRGLTQEALAERAGQDLSYLQRVERGATNLTVGVLLALAKALGVPPAALVRKARPVPVKRGRPPKRKKASDEKSRSPRGR